MCDSLMAEVQAGATVDLTPVLPRPQGSVFSVVTVLADPFLISAGGPVQELLQGRPPSPAPVTGGGPGIRGPGALRGSHTASSYHSGGAATEVSSPPLPQLITVFYPFPQYLLLFIFTTSSTCCRMVKYQAEERKAKEEGNSSKARRMGRISKQYQVCSSSHFPSSSW